MELGARPGGRSTSPVARALDGLGIGEGTRRIVAATPSLRLSWLLAVAIATVFATWGASIEPRLLPAFLIAAPVLPVAGVAAAYGPWADPMFEITRATPESGLRVLMLRTIAVLGASLVILGVASLVLSASGSTSGVWAIGAWVLPALALSLTSLMLSTFISLPRSAAIVTACWLVAVVWAGIMEDLTWLFQGPAQVAFSAIAVTASLVLMRRRQCLEIEGLRSRRATVDAVDTERRRIERNIHDGAQQQLVAIGIKAGLARTMVGKDPDRAIAIIDQLRVDAQEALDGLRDLTRGAYPPILADEGLEAALALRTKGSPVPVTLEAHDIGRLSKPVEVAIYFCCLEALQNATKYAKATRVAMAVRSGSGELSFSVSDDGVGFEPSVVRRGVGMRSMMERVESLGGTLDVRSAPGVGTAIAGRLPADGDGRPHVRTR